MTNLNKAKRVLLTIAAAFFALVMIIYAAAFPQLRYSDVPGTAPERASVVGEIIDGMVVTQVVSVEADQIRSLSFLTGTFDRDNSGTLNIAITDPQGETMEESLDISKAKNNQYTSLKLSKPMTWQPGEKLAITFTTQGCSPGNAITIYTGTAMEGNGASVSTGDYAKLDGEPADGMLCVKVQGVQDSSFYIIYWAIVLGVFLIAFAVCAVWWRKAKRGENNPLVAVCVLFTRYKLLFKQLVSRDFKAKYKRSVLGLAWSFLNPLLTMTVQYIVFSTLFRSNIENYPVYLLSGIVFFNFFTESVTMGMTSITSNASLIKKVYVPKYIYPFTRVISSLINFLLALIPLCLVMIITGTAFRPSMLLLIFDILCLTGFCIGMGLMLSTAMTFFQDTQFLWGVVSMIWMYFTPLFYPESIIPARIKGIYRLNPMYQFITFSRTCIIEGVSPAPVLYLQCIVSAAAAILLGVVIFKKNQDRFILYL